MSWNDIYCNFYQPPRVGDVGMVITSAILQDSVYDPIDYLNRIATEPELNRETMWRVYHEARRRFFAGQRSPSFTVVMEEDGLQGHVATGFGQIVARFTIENRAQDRACDWLHAGQR